MRAVPPDIRRLPPPLLWAGVGGVALAILLGVALAFWVLPDDPPPALVVERPAAAPAEQVAVLPLPTAAEQTAAAPPPLPAPLIADARLSRILAGRQGTTVFYRLIENPRILVIDFPSLAEQGRMMNRIAALVEKAGAPRDRLLSDAELTAFISTAGNNTATFYFAHDYAAPALARFYSLAQSESEALNLQEKNLLEVLIAAGMLDRAASGYVADDPELALISIVQPQEDDPTTPESETVDPLLRETMLRHEVSHGEFFTNPAYREHCERFWEERLSADERARFRDFLARSDYDPNDEALMVNEAQAYLMHTPDPRVFSAAALGVSEEQLVDLRRRFMSPQPPTPLLGGARPQTGATAP